MCNFQERNVSCCPYEEMFSHFKLLTETFSYFARQFYILILTFNK